MKSMADKGWTDRNFEVAGHAAMRVYLKLQPHRQVTIRQVQQHKLSAKYKLELPGEHDTPSFSSFESKLLFI